MALKPKQINQIVIIGGLALVAFLIWYLFFRNANKQDGFDPTETTPGGTPLPTSKKLPKVGNNTVLSKGAKAQEVQWMQYLYNKYYAIPKGKTKLVEDGIFGSKTETAVLLITKKKSTSYADFKATVEIVNRDSGLGTATEQAETRSNVILAENELGSFNSGDGGSW